MKTKTVVALMLATLLMVSMFTIFPVRAQDDDIVIGILMPYTWTVGDGMEEGAILAAEEINNAGGINGHNISIVTADTLRGQKDPDSTSGTLAMTDLLGLDVDIAIGCFRSESAFGARSVAVANQIMLFLCGAATTALVDCKGDPVYENCTDTVTPEGYCVRHNYERYKYVFRNTPMNASFLLYSLVGMVAYGIQGFISSMIAQKLKPTYGNVLTNGSHPIYGPYPYGGGWPQVKYAIISEAGVWATTLHFYLTAEIPGVIHYSYFMGPYANMTYETRVDAGATDVSTEVAAAVASGARLLIQVSSGPVGGAITNEVAGLPEADRPIVVGINVVGQDQPDFWTTTTTGGCEYETMLVTAGTRTPLNDVGPTKTVDFWDAYIARWGRAPVYTAYGIYGAIMGIADALSNNFNQAEIQDMIHGAGSFNQTQYDLLIPYIEMTDRMALTGNFKYTGPNPGHNWDFSDYDPLTAGNQPYPFASINPTMKGTLHDLWVHDLGLTWPSGYSRALCAQWQGPATVHPEFPGSPTTGTLEVVNPQDQVYSRRWMLPPWFYPLDGVDINFDGTVNILDAIRLAGAFGTEPGDTNWNIEADIKVNGVINILDAIRLAGNFGDSEPIPYPDP